MFRNQKFNTAISLLFLFLTIVRCSAPQIRELPLRPNPYTVDVAELPPIDYDAYNIPLPSIGDGGLRLTVGSGEGGVGASGELLAALGRNQPAPFAGVLFNGPALARIEVEFRGQETQCRIDRRADLDRLSARAVTDLRLLQTSFNSQGQAYTLMLTSRDQELERLYRQLASQRDPPFPYLPVILGVGGALVVGLGVGSLLGVTLGR